MDNSLAQFCSNSQLVVLWDQAVDASHHAQTAVALKLFERLYQEAIELEVVLRWVIQSAWLETILRGRQSHVHIPRLIADSSHIQTQQFRDLEQDEFKAIALLGQFLAFLYDGTNEEKLTAIAIELYNILHAQNVISSDWQLAICASLMGYCTTPTREAMAWRVIQIAERVLGSGTKQQACAERVGSWLAEHTAFLATLSSWQNRKDTEASGLANQVVSHIEQYDQPWLWFRVIQAKLNIAIGARQQDLAQQHLKQLRTHLQAERLIDHAMYWRSSAEVATMTGDGPAAERSALQSLAIAKEVHLCPHNKQ